MRKDKEQQKKGTVNQLNIFRNTTVEPSKSNTDRIDMDASGGVELSSPWKRQRTLTENLLNKIVDYENLDIKWFARQGLQSLHQRLGVKVN